MKIKYVVLASVANKRFVRRLTSKRKKKERNRRISQTNEKKFQDQTTTVKLPKVLNINTHRKELVKAISDIRRMFKFNPSAFVLDHSEIEEVEVSALLVLTSEIQKNTAYKKLTLRSQEKYRPKSPKVNAMLKGIGYWKHFGIKTNEANGDNDFYLRITDGDSANFSEYTKIRQFYQECIGIENVDTIEKLDEAITESIANAVEHAYAVKKILNKRSTTQMQRHWWLCGFYDKTREMLQFVCYDQGTGLRAAANYNDTIKFREIFKDFTSLSDSDVIETLLKKDLTKYNDKDRGYGFKRFESLINEYNAGKLEIYSQKGYYCIEKNGAETEVANKKNYNSAIEGTLISWQLQMENKENENL